MLRKVQPDFVMLNVRVCQTLEINQETLLKNKSHIAVNICFLEKHKKKYYVFQ